VSDPHDRGATARSRSRVPSPQRSHQERTTRGVDMAKGQDKKKETKKPKADKAKKKG
jgi:hypothetical protein